MTQTPIETDTAAILDKIVYDRLAGDPALAALVGGRIINGEAAAAVAFPYIVFMNEDTRDVRAQDGVFIHTDAMYMIKAVTQAPTYVPLHPIVAAVTRLFGDATGQTAQAHWTSRREYGVQYPETVETKPYRHLGAVYRFVASAP